VDVTDLVAEQIAYYRAYASEYDRWWEHLGNRDPETAFAHRWDAESAKLVYAISDFRPTGNVLEIAGGTGNFTQGFARFADHLTVVDTAPEAIEINRTKLNDGHCPVEYVIADIFSWTPPKRYDAVVFTFWISHVPADRFAAFWSTVRAALAPGGRVFFCDSLIPMGAAASTVRRKTDTDAEFDVPFTSDSPEGISVRELTDGRQFRIIKRYWTPEELTGELRDLGWDADVRTTGDVYLWGVARPLAD
jgi:SAM-dependent methyltransferase